MIDVYLQFLEKVKIKRYTDHSLVTKFEKRIKKGDLSRPENEVDHFCSFLVPFHRESLSIYTGHHIKADEWIPPGGHIEMGESPEDTVRREFGEELSSTLSNELIEPFAISITNVFHPSRPCRIHNDFWFVIYMEDKIQFAFDKKEFHEAQWLPLQEAMDRAKRTHVITSLSHLL